MVALSAEGGSRAALIDMGLIVILALTPFVFLIAYEFRAHGLSGAAGWSLSTLGLHFMLKRLNERRLTVEEQNRRLESLNRELEHRERLSAIGKMSSVVSHQILQQLGVIGIYADLIRNADPQGDAAAVLAQARKNASAIEGALGDVNRVLTDLLVFSKDLRLNLYEHPLERVVAESLDECRAEAAQRGVTLRAECPPDISLMLDKLKMKQAITNVLRNAVEASRPAGEVVLRAAVRNGSVEAGRSRIKGRAFRSATARRSSRPSSPRKSTAPAWAWPSRGSSPKRTAVTCVPSPAVTAAAPRSYSAYRCDANKFGPPDHEDRGRRRGGSTIITATAQMPKMKPSTVHSFFE